VACNTNLEGTQHGEQRGGAFDDEVSGFPKLRRAFLRGYCHSNAELEIVQAAERIEVGRIVPRIQGPAERAFPEELPHGRSLVPLDRRAQLEHLAAPVRPQPCGLGSRRNALELFARSRLVGGLAVVKGDREAFVLVAPGPVELRELSQRFSPGLGFRRELEPVHADVPNAVHTDESRGLFARTPADAGDQGVPAGQAAQLSPRLLRHGRELGSRHDRRQRPVNVEQDCRALRRFGQLCEQSAGVPHGAQNTAVRLVAIGLAAGFFSALFGVGGGILIVPMLMLGARFAQRSAMGTSLAAAFLIALAGSITYAFHGEIKPGAAAIVGLPAAAGALVGTSLQQRLTGRFLSLAFALLLAGVGVRLLV
jgi:Sulfite exporter TauE/SafE